MFSVEPCDVPSVACCPSKPKVNQARSKCCQCVTCLQFNIKVGSHSHPALAPVLFFIHTDTRVHEHLIPCLSICTNASATQTGPTPPFAGRLSHVFGYALLRTLYLCVLSTQCKPPRFLAFIALHNKRLSSLIRLSPVVTKFETSIFWI